jgi:ribosome biogenesis GTPase
MTGSFAAEPSVATSYATADPADWGWDERWALAFEPYALAGLEAARVVAQHRGSWLIVGRAGELPAAPSGRLRHTALEGDLPAVGDWVAYSPSPHGGDGRIEAVLPRRSLFRRRAAGSQIGAQLIAANVDTLFVATSLNGDLNPRRLERYVAMGHDAGVEPVFLLTTRDLVDDGDAVAARLAAELGVIAIALSSVTGDGVAALEPWFKPGRTLAVVGSSGVGKSTLLNRLAGQLLMTTREIREDDARGRHTTTHRELFKLPGGPLMVDTPGMRELGLWDADEGVEAAFADIAEFAERCRFADCRHDREPGCAVREAIAEGRIDERRLRSYRKLSAEVGNLPPAALRRERGKQFAKVVKNAAAEAKARKLLRE